MIDFPLVRHTLANGLRVVVAEDHTWPLVAVNLWYNVGSRHEPPGRTGLAHLFEHLMFQGSAHVQGTGHITWIERVGGVVNGSTWFDRTNYYETVPAHWVELALWLEADRMATLAAALTKEKLDTQREVVKNERRWRIDNQPYGDWDERLQALLFPPDHPYHHPVIGSMADLDAATLEDAIAFFRTYYAPNNAVVTLCGDVAADRALALLETYFGDIPPGPPPPPPPGRQTLPLRLERPARQEVLDPGVALPRFYLGFRIPPHGDDRFYAADLLTHLLADGRASRLYRALVRGRQLAKDVSAFALPLIGGVAALVVRATAQPDVAADALEVVLREELDRLIAETPAPGEVERARLRLEAQTRFALQRVADRADLLSMYTMFFDDPGRLATELERYRALDAEALRRFAAGFLDAEAQATLLYRPQPAAAAAVAA